MQKNNNRFKKEKKKEKKRKLPRTAEVYSKNKKCDCEKKKKQLKTLI